MAVGNSKGLLVPDGTTDLELRQLTNGLPDGVKVYRVDERLSALGNTIVCNDSIAMVHPDIDRQTIDIIEDIFNILIKGNKNRECVLFNNKFIK